MTNLVKTNGKWYIIKVDKRSNNFVGTVSFFSNCQGDLGFQLIDSCGNVINSITSITECEFVQGNNLAQGTYYLRVDSRSYPIARKDVEHTLQWNYIFRSNQTFYFEIEIDSGFDSSVTASIYFDRDLGDLDLQLFDYFGNRIDIRPSFLDNEAVEASDLFDDTYYLIF